VRIPDEAPESEVKERVSAESVAAADLARQGHLVRLWKPPVAPERPRRLAFTVPTPRRSFRVSLAPCRSTAGCT
jgi:muconolactone delta-isomerase